MKTSSLGTVAFGVAWMALAAAPASEPPRPGATPPEKAAQGRTFSGRVVDGLGRPVPDVTVSLSTNRKGQEKALKTVLRTGDDGRFSVVIPTDDQDPLIWLKKDDYGDFGTGYVPGREYVMPRKVDWDEASVLAYQDGDKLDNGVREVLASADWERKEDGKLVDLLFNSQEKFRPALRRLTRDAHVGAMALDWLDLLDDPADRDLFPKGRRYAPKKEVKETDLIEALKATARQRHFNSTAPEPFIGIDFIAFTDNLDRAFIQCGINRAAMTGITWQFVFRKAGKHWELRSAKQAGRS